MYKYAAVMLALTLLSCSDTRPFLRQTDRARFGERDDRPDNASVVTFYALGDWGSGNANQKAVAEALRADLSAIAPGRRTPPFVLAAGDNIYEHGLPEGWNNEIVTQTLERTFGQMYADIEYHGQPVPFHLVAGNHDHAGKAGGKNGMGDVIHQETTAERIYSNWEYYPISPEQNPDKNDSTEYVALKQKDILTLATPEQISLGEAATKQVSIFAIDTQVLLDLYDQKSQETLDAHWSRLAALADGSPAKWKFLLGHHPIKSHGTHGGFRSAIWWVPPVILATLVDKLFYRRLQDLDHPAYRQFQRDLTKFMDEHSITSYFAGHEHNLQFLTTGRDHFQIISGSAGKLTKVTHKGDTVFSHAAFGFVRFDLTQTELWIEFFGVKPERGTVNSTGLFRIGG